MISSIDLLVVFLFLFCLHTQCITLETQHHVSAIFQDESEIDSSLVENSKIKKLFASPNNFDLNNNQKLSKNNHNNDQVVPIHKSSESDPGKYRTTLNKEYSGIALEGGGMNQQTYTTLPNNDHVGLVITDETNNHSKGRKGVDKQVPSVVARKGVDLGKLESNNTLISESTIHQSPVKDSSILIGNEKTSLNNTDTQKPEVGQNHAHKKPEVVSDEGDTYDFDKYPIIKTSTTGEDYVVIGIVIVIGIWFSVFGALIFYRQAGEYWDRRHYRRMDFLVEGMYND